ncbi:MAG TPA: ABC transporter permease [Candidatus Eremiobacteraeota bacterium]|nr:ABC transporter permease [Candidatus Eremiobacteraeota bacterium]
MNFLLRYLNLAIDGFIANKLRSFLSVLSLSLGVTSIIIVMALSQGAEEALRNFNHMKKGWFIIQPDLIMFPEALLEYKTCKTIKDNCLRSVKISPFKEVYMECYDLWIRRYEKITGISEYVELYQPLLKGRFINYEDIASGNSVCVMVNSVLESNPLDTYFMFYFREPLDKRMKIKNSSVQLIGILDVDPYGQGFGIDNIIMPITTVISMTGDKTVNKIEVKMSSSSEEEAIEELREALKIDYQYKYHWFKIEPAMKEFKSKEEAVRFSGMVLFSIALITLSVSGTDIINILMVSVYERVLEIGIRRSLGASKKEILIQFLIEACLICFAGGLLGILISWLSMGSLIKVINDYGLYNIRLSDNVNWPFLIPFSLIFSSFLGIIFGVYPASLAAKLDIVECLRYAEGDY